MFDLFVGAFEKTKGSRQGKSNGNTSNIQGSTFAVVRDD